MPPDIPWNEITCKGILVGFALAGIIGFLANRILWKSGLTPIHAFFKPQRVSHQTKKSPFQVLLGCLGGMIIIAFVIGFLVYMTGAANRYLPFLPGVKDTIVRLADGQVAGLVLVGLMVIIIAFGLKISGKGE